MASNDQYNTGRPDPSERPYRGSYTPSTPIKHNPHAALPPLPMPTSSYTAYRPMNHSPTSTPLFDKYSELDSPNSLRKGSGSELDQRYFGAGGGGTANGPGPFADDIPLRKQEPRPYPDNNLNQSQLPSAERGEMPMGERKPRQNRQRSRRKDEVKKGFFGGKIPWVCYILTLIQCTVFIVELVRNSILTSSPIEIHPQINPMLGPSIYVLINMGARFVPCMKSVPGIQDASQPVQWPCPNTTTLDLNSPMNNCQLSDLCGFQPVPNPHVGGSISDLPQPNQWFRFIIPMFLHAGIIHISFNMLMQLTIGREIEKIIGSIRFLLVYLSSGIFGFVMGGNFAPPGIASTGASGALFGIIAITLLDLLYTWNERRSPGKDLLWICVDIVISFALGLLPGLDNFSHIGGFLMGLVLGVCILHSPNTLRQRVLGPEAFEQAPYTPVGDSNRTGSRFSTFKAKTEVIHPELDDKEGMKGFAKQPIGFFKGRKPLWWIWWIVRAGALIGVLACFIVLLNNFYKYRNTCSWCKYLSCLPVKNWCNVGNIQFSNTTTTPAKRDLFFGLMPESATAMAMDFQGFT